MKWRDWIKLERLIPILILLIESIFETLGLIRVISLSIGEQMLLFLLLLISIYALTERLTILENIKKQISNITTLKNQSLSSVFQSRSILPPLEERLENAKSLDIAGLSLLATST